jgi:hypothetical protein
VNGSRHQTSWTFRGGAERISAQYGPRIGRNSHRITAEVEVGDKTPNGVIFAYGGRTGGVALFAKNGQLTYEGTPRSSSPTTAPHTQIIATEPLPKGKSVIEVDATRIDLPAGGQETSSPQAVSNSQGLGGLDGSNTNLEFNISLLINGKTVATGEFKGIPLGVVNGFGSGASGSSGNRQGTNTLRGNFRGANVPAGGGGGGGILSIGSNKGTPVSNDYVVPNPFNGDIGAVTFAITSPEEDAETN